MNQINYVVYIITDYTSVTGESDRDILDIREYTTYEQVATLLNSLVEDSLVIDHITTDNKIKTINGYFRYGWCPRAIITIVTI